MGADWRNDASLEVSNLREIHYFPDNNAEKRLLLDGQGARELRLIHIKNYPNSCNISCSRSIVLSLLRPLSPANSISDTPRK